MHFKFPPPPAQPPAPLATPLLHQQMTAVVAALDCPDGLAGLRAFEVGTAQPQLLPSNDAMDPVNLMALNEVLGDGNSDGENASDIASQATSLMTPSHNYDSFESDVVAVVAATNEASVVEGVAGDDDCCRHFMCTQEAVCIVCDDIMDVGAAPPTSADTWLLPSSPSSPSPPPHLHIGTAVASPHFRGDSMDLSDALLAFASDDDDDMNRVMVVLHQGKFTSASRMCRNCLPDAAPTAAPMAAPMADMPLSALADPHHDVTGLGTWDL